MIDPHVRTARPGDFAELLRLATEARRPLDTQRGGRRWLDTHPLHEPQWRAAVEDGRVLLAVLDEVPVGYLMLGIDSAVATVTEVYVMVEARELGFGDALLEAATTTAAERDCEWLEGLALPGDRDTKNLYERAGITARLIVVSRRL